MSTWIVNYSVWEVGFIYLLPPLVQNGSGFEFQCGKGQFVWGQLSREQEFGGTGRSQLELSCTDVTSQPHLNTELANCCFPRKRHHWDLWNHRTNTGRAEGGAKGSIKSKPCSRGSESLLITSWSLLIWPVVASNKEWQGNKPWWWHWSPCRAPLAALTHSLFTSRASRDAKQGTARLSSALSTGQPFKPFLQGSRAPRNLLELWAKSLQSRQPRGVTLLGLRGLKSSPEAAGNNTQKVSKFPSEICVVPLSITYFGGKISFPCKSLFKNDSSAL